jgi:hypothetical protein
MGFLWSDRRPCAASLALKRKDPGAPGSFA